MRTEKELKDRIKKLEQTLYYEEDRDICTMDKGWQCALHWVLEV